MRRPRLPIPLSILLFLAFVLGGTYWVRGHLLRRALVDAMDVGDAKTIETLLTSWPCPLDVRGGQGAELLLWAEDQDEMRIARLCREKGVPPAEQSWFPLGDEVYHEGDRDAAAGEVLAFRRQPRWFKEWPRKVTRAEYDAWEKDYEEKHRALIEVMWANDNERYVPGPSTHPRDAMDLPVEDQGVTLALAASATDNASVLRFELTLASRSRDVGREVEHRTTNVLPFLFAFYADGRPVIRRLTELDKEGGSNWEAELVKEGGNRTWSLRVDAASLSNVLPRGAREVAIVAAFSDRQHEPWMPDGMLLEMSWRLDMPPRILVRSNAVRLPLDGNVPARPSEGR